jgi:Fe-S-cluster containining protein
MIIEDLKNCGDCHECCSLPAIKDWKSDFTTCKHLGLDGCEIYKDRPIPCRAFNCLWRTNYKLDAPLRPDRCGVMFEAFPNEKTVIALMQDNAEWETGPVKQLIDRMVTDDYVVWMIRRMKNSDKKERNLVLPKGITEKSAHARAVKLGQRMSF